MKYDKQLGRTNSIEKHTTLSGHPFRLNLPPGSYELEAMHGKEFLPARTKLRITDSTKSVDVQLRLRRFADMASRGWYSGDTHVHRSLEELPNIIVAEDLNVALPLTQWVRDSTQIPAANGPEHKPEPKYVDRTHVIYPVNTEYEIFSIDRKRHTQGAVFVLNHKSPLKLPAPPALPIAEEARRQGAILDLDKQSWNWSLMIVPTMHVDLFELTNNHHWRTQFGFPKWTLENAPDWPEIEIDEAGFTERGWTNFGLETYYGLLNCGFRMRVSGGTASGVHPVPLGHGRVYVHCGKTFDYPTWIRSLNAGHSFVTQGPLLDVRFNGQLAGGTWQSRSPEHAVTVAGTIDSIRPLKAVELVCNGEVVARAAPQPEKSSAGSFRTHVRITHKVKGSGWLALRCFEDLPGDKVSFAHTNPHFIDVEGHPLRPRKSRVRYFVERMEAEIVRNENILSAEAVAEFRKARDIYKRLLRTAR